MSAAASTATARLLENPFWVLGLPVTATRMELEREAQKLLGMLELGLAAVASYATPLGARPRTAELVRSAVATLRDPARRLAAEIWARAPLASADADTPPTDGAARAPEAAPAPWPDAAAILGWRPR